MSTWRCNYRVFTDIYSFLIEISDDIRTIKRNADVLLNACMGIDLAVNIGKLPDVIEA